MTFFNRFIIQIIFGCKKDVHEGSGSAPGSSNSTEPGTPDMITVPQSEDLARTFSFAICADTHVDATNAAIISRSYKMSGGAAFGCAASAGVLVKLNPRFIFFGEVEMVNLSRAPATGALGSGQGYGLSYRNR